MRTGRRRCAQCKYDFTPHQLPLQLTKDEWREILHLFLMEQSSNSIVEQTGLDKKRLLRALLRVRVELTMDVPAIFFTTIEVDETYLRGDWRNKGRSSGIPEPEEVGEPRSNHYLEFYVGMVRYG